MKACELCKATATMYCEPDLSYLCWDCDAKVHSANFLVARHSRNLLCHVCQSPTAWNAAGAKLVPTVSVCEDCVRDSGAVEIRSEVGESEGGNDDETDMEDDYDDDEDEDEAKDDEIGEDDGGDNQVVPWSSSPPPPTAVSSSGQESANRSYNGGGGVSLKRMRDEAPDLPSEEDLGCSYSERNNIMLPPPSSSTVTEAVRSGGNKAGACSSMRPLKIRKSDSNLTDRTENKVDRTRSAAIVEAVRRFHEQGMNASSAMAGIHKLRKAPTAVDFDLSDSS